MRILVLGAGGMLGKALLAAAIEASAEESVVGLTRKECDILQPLQLEAAQQSVKPTLVINAAGAPNKNELVNSLGPWYVSRVFSCPIWHISTDCVFNHESKSVHKHTDTPYPLTEYGISKLLGEQIAPHVSNIRTSFIGYEHGLLRWLLDQKPGATVDGWDLAFWSGSTVRAVADRLMTAAINKAKLPDIVHLAVDTNFAVSKYDLLAKLIRHYKLDLALRRVSTVQVNRLMVPTCFLDPIDRALDQEPRHDVLAANA